MTENRYDDELLSAIIDGEAAPESVASVEADPIARQRLANMRTGVDVVSRPVPEATPERRAQSIAAAMAAATPASPEITSLSAERHKRDEQKKNRPPGWIIAAAAAILLFVLATPVLFNLGNSDTADLATVSDAAEEVVEEVDEEAAFDEEAMEDEEEASDGAESEAQAVQEADEALADDASVDASPAAESAAAAPEFVDRDIEVVTSIEDLDLLLDNATITADLTANDILAFDASLARSGEVLEEILATDVNPECLNNADTLENATPYSVVVLDPFAGAPSLVIVEFGNDGMTRLLDAETCAVLR